MSRARALITGILLLIAAAVTVVFAFHYVPVDVVSFATWTGIAASFIGLLSIIRPLSFLGIRNRAQAALGCRTVSLGVGFFPDASPELSNASRTRRFPSPQLPGPERRGTLRRAFGRRDGLSPSCASSSGACGHTGAIAFSAYLLKKQGEMLCGAWLQGNPSAEIRWGRSAAIPIASLLAAWKRKLAAIVWFRNRDLSWGGPYLYILHFLTAGSVPVRLGP